MKSVRIFITLKQNDIINIPDDASESEIDAIVDNYASELAENAGISKYEVEWQEDC